MQRILSLYVALVAMLLVAASSDASPGPTAAQQIQSRQYLVGTWHCSFTVGQRAGTYTTTWSTALDNLWLKQTYDQPPVGGEPGFKSEYYIGYDEQRQGWVRFGAMTTGQYFAIRMTDTANGGWTWKYVSFFKRTRPETPDVDATFTKRSDMEYTVDGPSYPKNGQTVTEHHICRKT